jgi:hypothetical protein
VNACPVVADDSLILPGFASVQINSINQVTVGPDGITTAIVSIAAPAASTSLSAPVGLGAHIQYS